MAFNLWKAAGKSLSFNPLLTGVPTAQSISSTYFTNNQYQITFYASSNNSALLRISRNAANTDLNLTPNRAFYTVNIDFSKESNASGLVFYDVRSTGDIIIDSITLTQKPLNKLSPTGTANRSTILGTLTAEKSYTTESVTSVNAVSLNDNPLTKNSTATVKANLAGKVSGNTDLIPHMVKRDVQTSLRVPSTFGTELDNTQYPQIITQDGNGFSQSHFVNTGIDQMLYSFDLIRLMQDKFGSEFFADTDGTVAGKVTKLKNVLTRIQADWWGYGSTILSNPTQTTDFTGKVAGSVTENANTAKFYQNTILGNPTTSGSEFGVSSALYTSIYTQDGTNALIQANINGQYAQAFFSFNLIEYIKRKYSFTPDVTWLKANITNIVFNCWGFGSSPTGNKMTVQHWYPSGSYWASTGTVSHTNATVTKISSPATPNVDIDSNGFVYFVAYSDPSNGTTNSIINIDYVSLDVTLNAGSNKAYFTEWLASTSQWAVQNNPTFVSFHTSGSSVKLTRSMTISSSVDSNGFVHAIAYADPSNGVNPSTINTDYIELTVDINMAETGYDTYVDTDATRQLPALSPNMIADKFASPNEASAWYLARTSMSYSQTTKGVVTISANGTQSDQYITFDNRTIQPSKTYTLSYEATAVSGTPSVNARMPVWNGGTLLNDVSGTYTTLDSTWKTIYLTFTMPSNATNAELRMRFQDGVGYAGTIQIRNVTFKQGTDISVSKGLMKNKTLNFLGKVSGSTAENPNRWFPSVGSSFASPTTFISGSLEHSTFAYSNISLVDGNVSNYNTSATGSYAQELFEFDLSNLGLSLTDLKSAIKSFTVTWAGYGSGDNAGALTYGATFKIWATDASIWSSAVANTTNTSSTYTWTLTDNATLQNRIGSSQKVYVLMHSTYPASATNPSNIYTDYVKLDITLADYVDYVKTNGVKLKQADLTKVKLYGARLTDSVAINYSVTTNNLYPKKNLISNNPSQWEQGGLTGVVGNTFTANKQAATGRIRYINAVPVKPNTTYALTLNSSYVTGIQQYNTSDVLLADSGWITTGTPYTFTTRPDTAFLHFAVRWQDNVSNIVPNDIQNVSFQIEKSSIATSYTPYDTQVNKVPMRYVPKKNLFNANDGNIIYNSFIDTSGNIINGGTACYSQDYIPVLPNTNYTFSNGGSEYFRVAYYDSSKTFIRRDLSALYQTPYTVITPSNCAFIRLSILNIEVFKTQLEQGTTATPYEPYQLVLPKANTGLSFNGTNDYIDCGTSTNFNLTNNFSMEVVINPISTKSTYILNKGTNDWAIICNFAQGTVSLYTNGQTGTNPSSGFSQMNININQINKIKYTYDGVTLNGYVNDILILSKPVSFSFKTTSSNLYIGRSAVSDYFQGIVQSAKVVNNGIVVLNYDFTNTKNIVGNTVIPNAQNLIPNFEDPGWSINANAKVMGKDVLHLDATGANNSQILINVTPNTNYLLTCSYSQSPNHRIRAMDSAFTTFIQTAAPDVPGGRTFNSGSYTQIGIRLENYSGIAGAYDFIKPTLIPLNGTEGTIYGTPLQKNKTTKRTLYAKR